MPCNDGYGNGYCYGNCGSGEVSRLSARNDELARENCLLRESIIKLATAEPGTLVELAPEVMEIVRGNQVEHRKEDLKRLKKTLLDYVAKNKDNVDSSIYEKLGRVMTATPKEPLEPQLGFDPDAY